MERKNFQKKIFGKAALVTVGGAVGVGGVSKIKREKRPK